VFAFLVLIKKYHVILAEITKHLLCLSSTHWDSTSNVSQNFFSFLTYLQKANFPNNSMTVISSFLSQLECSIEFFQFWKMFSWNTCEIQPRNSVVPYVIFVYILYTMWIWMPYAQVSWSNFSRVRINIRFM
jgi:hypothetical protein